MVGYGPPVSLTSVEIRRRYLALQGLRWLPVGFVAPVLVLILSRELPLARIGPLLAIYGVTTALLELPTGGMADRWGRRPVLLASSVASVGFYALILASADMAVLALGVTLGGVSRALDSGPLEAWFVDATLEVDPDADIRSGLAAAGTINGVALALGSIAGGVLPRFFDGRLLAAVVAALVFQLLHLLAVAALLAEDRIDPDSGRGERASLRQVIGAALGPRSGGRPHLVFVGAAAIGVGLVAVESLWQPRFVDLLDRDDATVFLGVLLAVAFAASAVGAAVSPAVARRLEPRLDPTAAGQAGVGVTLFVLALASWAVAAGVLFVLFYALLGVVGPLRAELLHREVTAAHRSTALSGDSLALQFGGFVAALGLPPLADAHGIPLAWMIAGSVLGAGGLCYLRLRQPDGRLRPAR